MKNLHFTPARRAAAAFLVAVLTTTAAWWKLEKKEQQLMVSQKMTTVVRAKKYIPSGRRLTLDLVEEIIVPESALGPSMFTKKSELVDAQGAARFKSRIAVPKGEALCRPYLMDDATVLGLAWTLEPGQTAITLRLNSEEAVGGLLRPGDHVNVLCTKKEKSELLLARVLVGAVGEKILDPSHTVDAPDLSKPLATDSILVTLFLTQAEALAARSALASGSLTLSLLSPLGG